MIYAYIRVSGQTNYDSGLSIEEQRDRITAYCEAKDIGYPEFIIEPRAVSGSKSNRPGFNRLKELVLTGKAKVVLVYDLSRLSRDLFDSVEFLKKYVDRKGVRLISVNEAIDLSTSIGKQSYQMTSLANEWYRESVSKRMIMVKDHMRRTGQYLGGLVPYGFTVKDGQLIPLEYEQEIITLILTMYKEGSNLSAIRQKLFQLGIPTKKGKPRWSIKVLSSLIKERTDNAEVI